MEYKTVTYLNNFPHPVHGSLQPMRLGGEMLINESNGETPQQAWNRMHKDACDWHEEKSREIVANSPGPPQRPARQEDLAEQEEQEAELRGHLEVIQSLPSKKDINLYLKTAPVWLKYHEKV